MENSKTCTSCKKELSLEMFNNNKNHSDGLEYYCKDCKKLYRESLKSKIKSDKLPKKCASCGILKDIECFGNCGGCYDGLKPSCKQCRKEKEYEANKEYILEKKKGKKQIPITPEKRRQYKQKYLLTGRDVIRKASRDYHKRRRLSDPVFKLTNNIRTLIGTSFKLMLPNKK